MYSLAVWYLSTSKLKTSSNVMFLVTQLFPSSGQEYRIHDSSYVLCHCIQISLWALCCDAYINSG